MEKDRVKIFKDSVHGYIEIPSVIVSNIIDTEQFQRLRFIEQTSMRSVYPSARHDRFIHSLGVYYLGVKAFASFRANCRAVIDSLKISIPNCLKDEKWWDKQQLLFEIACLMHDCAHAPFSHTLEDYYYLKKNSEGVSKLTTLLEKECEKLDGSFEADYMANGKMNRIGAAHEKLSSYIILHEYKDQINDIFDKLLPEVSLEGEDFAFICRMIIGCRYTQNDDITNSLKNCIISLLNSSTIDVDGLDYIVRDAQMSGASTFNIDYQRIINSFTILPTVSFDSVKVKDLDISGIWLKDSNIKITSFTGSIRGEVTLSDPKGIKRNNSEEKLTEIITTNKGKVYKTKNFSSTLYFEGKASKDVEVYLTSSANVKCNSCLFCGTVSGRKIADDTDDLKDKKISFVLGYDKRCLSVIQNTIDARNNEYLWIYTHPKVQYNSHYLQSELLLGAARFLCFQQNQKGRRTRESVCTNCYKCEAGKEIPFYEDYILQILGYEELFDAEDKKIKDGLIKQGFYFYRSNDDDLNALFKRVYLSIKKMGENAERFGSYLRVYEEYSSRKQRKTIWKTFMEKEVFFDRYQGSSNTLGGISELIVNARESSMTKTKSYYTLSPDEQKVFSENGLNNVLIICANAKTKKIDFPEFFVKYGNGCARLCDVFDSNMITNSIQKDIEYFFYDGVDVKPQDFAKIDKELDELYDREI